MMPQAPFHGTNPIAFAAPVPGQRPFLLDMATSIVPWNRIRDYEMKGLPVPEDVAVDAAGDDDHRPSGGRGPAVRWRRAVRASRARGLRR